MIEYLVRKKKNSESERVEDGYERGLKRLIALEAREGARHLVRPRERRKKSSQFHCLNSDDCLRSPFIKDQNSLDDRGAS